MLSRQCGTRGPTGGQNQASPSGPKFTDCHLALNVVACEIFVVIAGNGAISQSNMIIEMPHFGDGACHTSAEFFWN